MTATTIVDATWRPLEPGDVVREGDAMRIGESFSLIQPCVYDQAGETCCVGAVVDERFRWYRAAERGERSLVSRGEPPRERLAHWQSGVG